MRRSILILALALVLVGVCFLVVSSTQAHTDCWESRRSTPEAGADGEAVVSANGRIYVMRCASSGTSSYFWQYDPSNDHWVEIKKWSDLPGSDLPRCKSGTALAWDQGDYIYILFGAAQRDSSRTFFYRYRISDGETEPLHPTPHAQGAGNALTYSGYDKKLYALLGSNNHGGTAFAQYDPSTNRWELMTLNPSWGGVTDDGASLVWTGGEDLYALQGEAHETIPNTAFARYHMPTGRWEDKSPIPENKCDDENRGGGCGVADGGSLLWIGNWMSECADYVFALGGGGVREDGGDNFYRYSISSNRWDKLQSVRCKVGDVVGNRLGFAAGHIYYWQGVPSTWECGGNAFYMYTCPP